MLQSTVTSMSSLPSVQHTRLRPKKKPVTDQEQLASIAKSDIALAVETPTLLHIAGAYSLNVSDTAKVKSKYLCSLDIPVVAGRQQHQVGFY